MPVAPGKAIPPPPDPAALLRGKRLWLARGLLVFPIVFLVMVGSAWSLQVDSCPVAKEMVIKGIDLFDLQPAKGLEALERAYGLCPTDLAIAYNFGLALYQADKKPRAHKVWTDLWKAHPEHLKTNANLAWLNFELGDDESAHILAFKGLNRFPGNHALAHTKLYSLYRLGRYLEAYDWLTRADLEGVQAKRWRQEAVGYVIEALIWKLFRKGERDAAVSRAVMLVKDYPEEAPLVEAKDRLVMAMVDPDAEVTYPIPLPHETWAKRGELDLGQETMDEWIQAVPGLNTWEKRGDAFALLVGVHQYRNLRGRPYADRDAINFHRLLTRRGLFLDNQEHIRLRTNGEATGRNLKQDVAWLVRQGSINPNAMLLFYFSGHGAPYVGADGRPDALLIPSDTPADAITPENAVSLAQLGHDLERLPNPEIAVILESCFAPRQGCSGQATPTSDGTTLPDNWFAMTKPWLLAAVNGESAYYNPGRQGALTFFLLKGMLGAADESPHGNHNGWVDLAEAFAYAKANMERVRNPGNIHMTAPSRLRMTKTAGNR